MGGREGQERRRTRGENQRQSRRSVQKIDTPPTHTLTLPRPFPPPQQRQARQEAEAGNQSGLAVSVCVCDSCLCGVRGKRKIKSKRTHPSLHPPHPQTDPQNRLPPDLLRRYQVLLLPRTTAKPLPLRSIGAPHVGALVRVRGVITHATDVKPLITVATYLDDVTGIEVYQEVTGRTFTPLAALPSGAARRAGGAAALHLQTRGSKFVKFQEVKLQELPLEVS